MKALVVFVDQTEVPETEPEVCSEAQQVQPVPEIVVQVQVQMVEGGRQELAMASGSQQAH